MAFDKTKLMRNAERYLAQGKIQSAIGEYKQVVANDPKDFGTLNMLGDLYTKNSEKSQAVKCYTSVAEHYSKQGFAQKAIAVYNKITKIQGASVEISAKLADLYKFKGAVNEARVHYNTVAEHYESLGQKVEALEVRKQIASLDPNDTTSYLKIAEAYLEEGEKDAAADAFAEAAARLAKSEDHTGALAALEKALELKPTEPKILAAFTQSHFALGSAATAAEALTRIHEDEPHDQEVLNLLIDCHLEAGKTESAEQAIISLVEKDPGAYPKLLNLARIYLDAGNADAAARVTTISSEHLLLAGQAEEFQNLVAEILAIDPEQLEGLRLKARLVTWQRDEAGMQDALAALARVARLRESIDDERLALSQLVMVAPQEPQYAERLREINREYGFEDSYETGSGFDSHFAKPAPEPVPEPELETFQVDGIDDADIEEVETEDFSSADFVIVDEGASDEAEVSEPEVETEAERLARESDSIRFYIDSGYLELAEKAIDELRSEFGDCDEVGELVGYLESKASAAGEVEQPAEAVPVAETAVVEDSTLANGNGNGASSGFGIHDLRSELGLDEPEAVDDSDYDTHYHTAVAYQEMGLLDEAIKEFQEAVSLVQPNDAGRRFFHCANLLGHCFMQKAMPNLALTWYLRALETPGLGDEEKQGIWYELASAYEAEGDMENAGRYFEQVYAENIDFRDVSERVKNMTVSR